MAPNPSDLKPPKVDSRFWDRLQESIGHKSSASRDRYRAELAEFKHAYDGFASEYEADASRRAEWREAMEGCLRQAWGLIDPLGQSSLSLLPLDRQPLDQSAENMFIALKTGIDKEGFEQLQQAYQEIFDEIFRRDLERRLLAYAPDIDATDQPFDGLSHLPKKISTWSDIFNRLKEDYALSPCVQAIERLEKAWVGELERVHFLGSIHPGVGEEKAKNKTDKTDKKNKKNEKSEKSEKSKENDADALAAYFDWISEHSAASHSVQYFVLDKLSALGVKAEDIQKIRTALSLPDFVYLSVDQLAAYRTSVAWDRRQQAAWYQPVFWENYNKNKTTRDLIKVEKTSCERRVLPQSFSALFDEKKPLFNWGWSAHRYSWVIHDATIAHALLRRQWQERQLKKADFSVFKRWTPSLDPSCLAALIVQCTNHFTKTQQERPVWFKWFFAKKDRLLAKWQFHQLHLFYQVLNEQMHYLGFLGERFERWADQTLLYSITPAERVAAQATLLAESDLLQGYIKQLRQLLAPYQPVVASDVTELNHSLSDLDVDLQAYRTRVRDYLARPEFSSFFSFSSAESLDQERVEKAEKIDLHDLNKASLKRLAAGQLVTKTSFHYLCDSIYFLPRDQRRAFALRHTGWHQSILAHCRELLLGSRDREASLPDLDAHAREYLLQSAHYFYNLQIASDLDMLRSLLDERRFASDDHFLMTVSDLIGASRIAQLAELKEREASLQAQLKQSNQHYAVTSLNPQVREILDRLVIRKSKTMEVPLERLAHQLDLWPMVQVQLENLSQGVYQRLLTCLHHQAKFMHEIHQVKNDILRIEGQQADFMADVPKQRPLYQPTGVMDSTVRAGLHEVTEVAASTPVEDSIQREIRGAMQCR